ncbi:MAG: YidC/Oxa1 family membrane protein insertase [Oscillospiraceae bacterium]|nr:YidC/Oxa1 family membrane protein insertase [Oscillospiraceae bacterium]MDD7355292.1 YidC/Oxa1 family membrane protein insertase [Oscillospiraceae bacterium]MDY3937022.1 YidC/Oxa1 family membrane protein insertase [Oscillospiraceae bacterium]
MQAIYNTIAIPFGWVLSFLYSNINNYLISLFILVLIVRLVLLPSSISQQKGSAKQLRLQPKVNRIRQRYTNGNPNPSREVQMKIQQETQELYQKEGFSATSAGCLPLLIQFPVMIGLYGVVYTPLSKVLAIKTDVVNALASLLSVEVTQNTSNKMEILLLDKLGSMDMTSLTNLINKAAANANATISDAANYAKEIITLKGQFTFLGIDLTQQPTVKEFNSLWLIPIAAFLTAMLTSVVMYLRQRKTNPEMAKNPSMGCMTFMSPLMSLWFAFMFPAGVGIYWVMSNIVSFVQTLVLNYFYSPQKVTAKLMVTETVERRSREQNVKKLLKFKENGEN